MKSLLKSFHEESIAGVTDDRAISMKSKFIQIVNVSKHIRGCQNSLFSKAGNEEEFRQMEKKIKGQYKTNEVQN